MDEAWITVNADGSFDEHTYTVEGEGVLRNHMGEVLAAEAKWYEHLPGVLTIEALAVRDGLLLAVAQGCSEVVRLGG